MLTFIVPMSGRGRAFVDKGYTFPKPLVEIAGRPLIEIVVRNLMPVEPHRFVFVCRSDHLQSYAIKETLQMISPNSTVISSNGETGGALCSVLLAIEQIASDGELVIANADQFIAASIDEFLATARHAAADGCIVVFPSTHPKWSYVRTMENGDVGMVAEKRPISTNATAGIYYFRRGGDFVSAAERMLLKGTKTANEFYLAPVYNEMILAGGRIITFQLGREQMLGLGTPEDVQAFSELAPSLLSGMK